MNGYFRIASTSTSTNLELYAPTDGGVPVDGQEVITYLTSHGIKYDAGSLGKALDTSRIKNETVTLCMTPTPPISAISDIIITEDLMKVYIRIISPSVGGMMIDSSDVLSGLAAKGVKYGIMNDAIEELIANPRFCEQILIAEGDIPGDSTDGYIEYLFNTDRSSRPTQNEDGSVDFFHLNVLQACAKDQVIAKLHKAKPGADGVSVEGKLIKSRLPKDVGFRYGANIRVSEDGLSLISEVDGNVSLVGEQVFVNNSLTFESVSTATGNIEFDGSVIISGNIDTNYEVRVKGDVTVNGVIEGAIVEAGGNIIVAKGVNGMGKAKLTAGGNIIAKYLENVEATAGGYIRAEAVMHSNISAGSDIIVDGRKGMLSGGKATAGGMIEVKNLGSEMANDTVVEVGISPQLKREAAEVKAAVAEKQKTLQSIAPVLNSMAMKVKSGAALTNEQKVYVGKLMAAQKATNEELETLLARMAELDAIGGVDTPSEVKVKDTVYPGTRVCISDVSMAVKTATRYCKFVKLRGDVKIASYE